MYKQNVIIGGISITPCEFSIIREAVKGLMRKEIASILQKELATLNTQMHTLYLKLPVKRINGLVAWAIENGFNRNGKYTPIGKVKPRSKKKTPKK